MERSRTSFTAHTYRFMEGCACVRVHACIGGARGGGWAETNRKQAFFIRASILNACLTYEAWFGATLARTLRAFFLSFSFPPLFPFFFHGRCILPSLLLLLPRHTNLPRIRVPCFYDDVHRVYPGRGVEQVVPLLHFIFNL